MKDFANGKIVKVINLVFLFIILYLSFIPQDNRSQEKIYHFFYSKSSLISSYIADMISLLFHILL